MAWRGNNVDVSYRRYVERKANLAYSSYSRICQLCGQRSGCGAADKQPEQSSKVWRISQLLTIWKREEEEANGCK